MENRMSNSATMVACSEDFLISEAGPDWTSIKVRYVDATNNRRRGGDSHFNPDEFQSLGFISMTIHHQNLPCIASYSPNVIFKKTFDRDTMNLERNVHSRDGEILEIAFGSPMTEQK
ncbi:hypothetical protein LIER_31520 [Lithospermum erythrorhizon]|uniref:Uncharacterized protein n=1 Tax=Lithospermum erythrorhizon TaxID=34254 RepID=A0AAV3RV80_LITER